MLNPSDGMRTLVADTVQGPSAARGRSYSWMWVDALQAIYIYNWIDNE